MTDLRPPKADCVTAPEHIGDYLMTNSSGALSGSRERSQSTLSPPIGFDPERGDAEMLAILLWDYFGPHTPRSAWQIEARSLVATEDQIGRFREAARNIAQSLRFYRNIRFDEGMIERGADQLEVRYGDSWTSREDYREAAKNVWLAMSAASVDRSPEGQDAQRLDAKHESAVGSEASETPHTSQNTPKETSHD